MSPTRLIRRRQQRRNGGATNGASRPRADTIATSNTLPSHALPPTSRLRHTDDAPVQAATLLAATHPANSCSSRAEISWNRMRGRFLALEVALREREVARELERLRSIGAGERGEQLADPSLGIRGVPGRSHGSSSQGGRHTELFEGPKRHVEPGTMQSVSPARQARGRRRPPRARRPPLQVRPLLRHLPHRGRRAGGGARGPRAVRSRRGFAGGEQPRPELRPRRPAPAARRAAGDHARAEGGPRLQHEHQPVILARRGRLERGRPRRHLRASSTRVRRAVARTRSHPGSTC